MCRSDATVAIHAKHLNFVQSGLSPIGFSFATSPSRHQRDMKKKETVKKVSQPQLILILFIVQCSKLQLLGKATM